MFLLLSFNVLYCYVSFMTCYCCQVTVIGENGLNAELLEEDKCGVMKDTVVESWRSFCTSRRGELDNGLLEHVLDRTTCWVSDRCPAVMKAARMLRAAECPNCEFIFADPCHVLRTTTQLVSDFFRTSEQVLFDDKNSVVPSIMNSHEWQNKFVWVQKLVSDHEDGAFAPALKACA